MKISPQDIMSSEKAVTALDFILLRTGLPTWTTVYQRVINSCSLKEFYMKEITTLFKECASYRKRTYMEYVRILENDTEYVKKKLRKIDMKMWESDMVNSVVQLNPLTFLPPGL
jgi:hypothetical protein